MSSYARQYLSRPSGVTFGSQRSGASGRPAARTGGGGNGNAGRDGPSRENAGGLPRFQNHQPPLRQPPLRHGLPPPQQPHPNNQQAQRRTAFSHEEVFQEAGGIEYLPLQGNIDAHEEYDLSQVTLSQLSDGPSVRSMKSMRSGRRGGRSLGHRGGGGEGRPSCLGRSREPTRDSGIGGGRGLSRPEGRMLNHRSSGSSSRGGGGLNLPGRGRQPPSSNRSLSGISGIGGGRAGERQVRQFPSHQHQSHTKAEDDASLRSSQRSQPLLSQTSRPTSTGWRGSNERPGSKGSRAGSNGRPHSGTRPASNGSSSRASNGRPTGHSGGRPREQPQQQQRQSLAHSGRKGAPSAAHPRRRDDDDSTALGSAMPPRPKARASRPPPPAMLRTPLPPHRRASSAHNAGRDSNHAYATHSAARTAVRTVGTLSHTLAALPTPSRIRTAATRGLAGAASALMTPFRKGRARLAPAGGSVIGTLGSAGLGSSRSVLGTGMPSSGRSGMGGPSRSLFGTAGSATPRPPSRAMAPRAALGASREVPAASSLDPRTAGRCSAAGGCVGGTALPDSNMKERQAQPMASTPRPESRSKVDRGDGGATEPSRDGIPGQKPAGKDEAIEKLQEATNDGAQKSPAPLEKASVAEANATPHAPPIEPNTANQKEAEPMADERRAPENAPPEAKGDARDRASATQRDTEEKGDDAASAGTASTLDVHGRVEEFLAASREMKRQRELLEASRREFALENERARKELREERSKLDALRGTLRSSMDAFSTRIASSAHEHELSLRTIKIQAMNDLSERARGTMKEMSSEVRALVEVEAKKRVAGVLDGAVEAAKGDLKEFADELKGAIGADGSNAGAAKRSSPSAGDDETAGDEASIETRDSVATEKENAGPGRDRASNRTTPMRSTGASRNNSAAKGSSPRQQNRGSTQIPRGGVSVKSTPFTQKSTPQQHNRAKNRKPSHARSSSNAVTLTAGLRHDFSAAKSPVSTKKAGRHILDASDSDDSNSVSIPTRQSLVLSRNAKAKGKVAKKAAPLSEAKQRSKAAGRATASPSPALSAKRRVDSASSKQSGTNDDEAARNAAKLKVRITVGQKSVGEAIVIERGASKKRSQSDADAAKSPRRSKRLKETTRVEQMTAKAADATSAEDTLAKPSEVTPKEDTPKENVPCPLAPGGDDASDDAQLSAICRSASSSASRKEKAGDENGVDADGFDSLLGTSVTVPSDDKRRDELIGFDEDEDTQPDRRSLTSLLPFGGFKSRSKSKTMSKKKAKRSSTFDFGFY